MRCATAGSTPASSCSARRPTGAGAVVAPADPEAAVVVAPDWADGMGASLRAGLARVPREVDAVLVLLVDTPGIGAEALRRVAAAATRPGSRGGATTAARGTRCCSGRSTSPASRRPRTTTSVRRGYLAGRDDVRPVEVGDVATRDDVDTPADLARVAGALDRER